MNATGSPTSEVWLRGNVRPVLVVAAVGGLAAIALLATLFLTAAPPTAWWLAIACCLVIAAVIGTLAFAAAQPRLVHEGDAVMVDGCMRCRSRRSNVFSWGRAGSRRKRRTATTP